MMTGKTVIHEDVFMEAARMAMQDVNEVFRQERKGPLGELTRIFADRFTPQITVKKTDPDNTAGACGKASYDLKLALLYGVNIPEAVRKVREAIIREVETVTGYTVERVDVVVEKLIKPDSADPARPDENEA